MTDPNSEDGAAICEHLDVIGALLRTIIKQNDATAARDAARA